MIIVGAGLIGLALGRELHQRGFRVLIFDRGEAGREASWAGAGMLAGMLTSNPTLRPLALAGAKLYPVWAADLERDSRNQACRDDADKCWFVQSNPNQSRSNRVVES